MIMINLILGLAALSYLFAVGAEPVQWVKTWFHVGPDSEYENKVQWFFLKLLNCPLCSGFWIGLICTNDLLLAGIISILAEYINVRLH